SIAFDNYHIEEAVPCQSIITPPSTIPCRSVSQRLGGASTVRARLSGSTLTTAAVTGSFISAARISRSTVRSPPTPPQHLASTTRAESSAFIETFLGTTGLSTI